MFFSPPPHQFSPITAPVYKPFGRCAKKLFSCIKVRLNKGNETMNRTRYEAERAENKQVRFCVQRCSQLLVSLCSDQIHNKYHLPTRENSSCVCGYQRQNMSQHRSQNNNKKKHSWHFCTNVHHDCFL